MNRRRRCSVGTGVMSMRANIPRLVTLCTTLAVVSAACFPKQPGQRLAHFATTAPAVGEPAPRFTLTDLGGKEVELASLIGERPIVLQLGSHSCPVYRYRRFDMEPLWKHYGDRVHFLIVYTVEAHPVGSKSPFAEGEWDLLINKLVGVRVEQPESFEARREQAATSQRKLHLAPMMVVDEMDNETWRAWGAASSPAFVIDQQGRIAARQVWLQPKEIRKVLDRLLAGGV